MVAEITNIDEFEVEYKKGVGALMDMPSRADATKDNILNFCDAVGDANPLWTNEEYAAKSRFGMITAPPNFLLKVNDGALPASQGTVTAPRKNLSVLYSGAEWEFFRPIWLGDRFTVRGKSLDIVRRETKSRGPVLFARSEVSYFNQRKELVGINRVTIAHVPLVKVGPGGAGAIKKHDPDKGNKPAKNPDVCAYEHARRGNKPRYWEDISEGQEMEPLEKGVLTLTEIDRFTLYVQQSPRILTKPRSTEVVIGLSREAGSRAGHGAIDAEDFGPQRTSWLLQYITDWMGDDGSLKKFSGQIRASNMLGDINLMKGKVTRKYVENGEHLVECDFWVENQGDNVTAPGHAVVALPTKS